PGAGRRWRMRPGSDDRGRASESHSQRQPVDRPERAAFGERVVDGRLGTADVREQAGAGRHLELVGVEVVSGPEREPSLPGPLEPDLEYLRVVGRLVGLD